MCFLTHPLAGSLKPNQTPYKSIIITRGEAGVDTDSVVLIENSIAAAQKIFAGSQHTFLERKILGDFRTVDLSLIENAMQKRSFQLNISNNGLFSNNLEEREVKIVKLELGKILIQDVQFGAKTEVVDRTLFVNKEEIIELVLEDDRLIGADVELARPGESVRIAPVKDVIEPRVKVTGGGVLFPGMINKVEQVGRRQNPCFGRCNGHHLRSANLPWYRLSFSWS